MTLTKSLLSLGAGAAALFLTAANASAAIVCSRDVCWHTHSRYDYPPEAGVTIHEDSWRWGPGEHFAWREHEGRGYWHGDKWKE